jgi:hypothetical protein
VLGISATDGEGEVVEQALALVPGSDFGLEDTWFVAGMPPRR